MFLLQEKVLKKCDEDKKTRTEAFLVKPCELCWET